MTVHKLEVGVSHVDVDVLLNAVIGARKANFDGVPGWARVGWLRDMRVGDLVESHFGARLMVSSGVPERFKAIALERLEEKQRRTNLGLGLTPRQAEPIFAAGIELVQNAAKYSSPPGMVRFGIRFDDIGGDGSLRVSNPVDLEFRQMKMPSLIHARSLAVAQNERGLGGVEEIGGGVIHAMFKRNGLLSERVVFDTSMKEGAKYMSAQVSFRRLD